MRPHLSNTRPGRRVALGLPVTLAVVALVLAATPAAQAAQPRDMTLTPDPPPFYTCTPIGNGTVCDALTTQDAGPEQTGIFCGSGAGAFEVVDMLATRTVDARRWYDADGNIVKRVRYVTFSGTRFGNPLTGAYVPYTQRDLDTETFEIPGDLDSARTVSEEYLVVRGPRGVLTVDAGRRVTTPDGTIVSETGRRDLGAYYSNGDRTKVDLICAALGA